MSRVLTDQEFTLYEIALYLRYLSEDFPFLADRRPEIEECLRKIKLEDGADKLQIFELLQEAEQELSGLAEHGQSGLESRYPTPFPVDGSMDRDRLFLAADQVWERESSGIEALFPEQEFYERLWKIFFRNLSEVPVGRDEAMERALRKSGQECTQSMRQSFPTDGYGMPACYRKVAERCIGAWTECLYNQYGAFLPQRPDRERELEELERRMVRNPFPHFCWAGNILPSGALLQRNVTLHVRTEIRHSLKQWELEREKYLDFLKKTLFRYLAEETKYWESILKKVSDEQMQKRIVESGESVDRYRRHAQILKRYRRWMEDQKQSEAASKGQL